MSTIVIYGGGTFSHLRNHLALAAPAFGGTARKLHALLKHSKLILTKMACNSSEIVSTVDLQLEIEKTIANPHTKYVVMNAAVCDFDGQIGDVKSGELATRLKSREDNPPVILTPADKLVNRIKIERPDITLITFKTTCGASQAEQIKAAEAAAGDIVVANDTLTGSNVVVRSTGSNVLSIYSDRDACINALAANITNLQLKNDNRILFENDAKVLVKLPPRKSNYERHEADHLIRKMTGYDIKSTWWDSYEENAIWGLKNVNRES